MDIPNAAAPGSGPHDAVHVVAARDQHEHRDATTLCGSDLLPDFEPLRMFPERQDIADGHGARAARRGPSSTESIPKPAADAGGADFLDAAREVLDLLDDRVEIAAEARRAGLALSHAHRRLQEYQQTRSPSPSTSKGWRCGGRSSSVT